MPLLNETNKRKIFLHLCKYMIVALEKENFFGHVHNNNNRWITIKTFFKQHNFEYAGWIIIILVSCIKFWPLHEHEVITIFMLYFYTLTKPLVHFHNWHPLLLIIFWNKNHLWLSRYLFTHCVWKRGENHLNKDHIIKLWRIIWKHI